MLDKVVECITISFLKYQSFLAELFFQKNTTVITLLCNWVCIFLLMKCARHNQTSFVRQKNSKKLAKKNHDERMTYLVKRQAKKTSIPVHLTFFEAVL